MTTTTTKFRACVGFVVVAGTLTTILTGLLTRKRRPDEGLYLKTLEFFQKVLMALMITEFVTQILFWIRYKPNSVITDDNLLPTISVVIPAYNESSFVRNSIGSVLASDYPKEKVKLIVVDDGSTDDTWLHIQESISNLTSARCKTCRHQINMGKRQAIRTGFQMVEGDIIVSLDSDSLLEAQALRALVAPFVRDSNVGGVAGHLAALNVDSPGKHSPQATIPRFLDILFEYGGNIPRTAQSAAGFVTILPGAISAFRAAAVKQHADALCDRLFLGEPLRHGEDVELTFLLLRAGWRTVYQSNAVVHTAAPQSPRRAMLMYTRWERSSYVYFAMGYLGLVVAEALKCFPFRNYSSDTMIADKEKQEDVDVRQARQGSLYPALSMLCTILGNPSYIFCSFSLMVDVFYRPERVLANLTVMGLLSIWRSLLFIADALQDQDRAPGRPVTDEVAGIKVYNRATRLAWRLQYAAAASCFQMVYVSWSSVFGLCTIKSQNWLTR